jgi:hypothetical protein
MRADADISALVDTIYDAAVDPSRWGTALTNLARALQADASSIVVQDRLTQTFWNIDTGSQIVLAQAYDGWTAINPLWPPT